MASLPSVTRTALVREKFGFYTVTGELRTSSTLQALKGGSKIKLPPGTSRPGRPNARLLDSPVPPPTEVPTQLDAVKGFRIERVQTRENMALWNTLMAEEHPQGCH